MVSSDSPTFAGDLGRDAARERVRGELFGIETSAPTIDRFTVLRTLGAGGMGTVYAVHDPRLERDIALKVLRHDELATAEQRKLQHARLIREARAMGRLSHPNVGAVYEVGVVEGVGSGPRVWIAMEMIDGESLSTWCRRERPSVREILDVYVQFGRGLAAAHRANLVHSDVKPENAMRDSTGRVRVLDFGLASGADESPTRPSGPELDDLDLLSFTRTGAVIGTPAYMAPEQFDGQRADARADQYAFCVGLYQALWRQNPHSGRSVTELAIARKNGELVPPPRRRSVPRRVRAAVLRGLSIRADDRWPSMEALVRELEPKPSRALVPVGISALAVVAVVASRPWAGAPDLCPDPVDRLAGVWDPARAEATRAAFAASGSPIAGEAAERVTERLEGYATQWRAAVVDACRATKVEGTQSSVRLDTRMACLDRRLHRLDALASALSDPDRERVLGAVDLVGRLGDLGECAESSRADAYPLPADPDLRNQINQLELDLNAHGAQWIEMPPVARVTKARELLQRARELEHPPLVRDALVELLEGASNADDNVLAIDTARELAQVAAALHDDAIEAVAWTALVSLETYRHRREAAGELEAVATAAVARAGDPVRLRYRLALSAAARKQYLDDHVGAVEGFSHAVELAANDLQRSIARQQLAQSIALAHGPLAAVEAGEQAVTETQLAYGPGHPRTADALHMLARFVAGPVEAGKPTPARLRRIDRADSLQSRAIAIYEATLPPTHRDLAIAYHQAGDLASRRDDLVRARQWYERAVPIFEAGRGVQDAALTLGRIAKLLADEKGLEAARSSYERALELTESTFGRDNTHYTILEINFAQNLIDADDCAAAEPRLEHVAEVMSQRSPKDAPWSLLLHAECDVAAGRVDAAIARLEKGRTLCREHGCQFAMDLDFALGRTLIDARRDSTRGEALVAEAAHVAEREGAADMREEIAAWRRTKR